MSEQEYLLNGCNCAEGYCSHCDKLVVGQWFMLSHLKTSLGRKYREILSQPKVKKRCNCKKDFNLRTDLD